MNTTALAGDRQDAALDNIDPLEAERYTALADLYVLDVGCGGGILSESMARLDARVHGSDVVQRNIAIACEHAAGSGLDVRYEQATVGGAPA